MVRLVLTIFICFSLIPAALASAQPLDRGSIRGMITDSATGEPLPYTNVFLSNTTLGDAADQDGEFIIAQIPPGFYQLVVSRIGYHMAVQDIAVQSGKTTVSDVSLTVKAIEGEEIIVVARDNKQWKRDLQEFTSYFIGETANAQKCTIVNPEVLAFQRQATQHLVATSDSIIVVENMALGYRIDIILDSFRWGNGGGFYLIYPRYVSLEPRNERQAKRWTRNRQQTFHFSLRHFFASLAAENHQESYIVSRLGKPLPGSFETSAVMDSMSVSLVDSTRGLRRLRFDGLLQVVRRAGGSSNLYLNYGYVDFDPWGNIYPADAVKIYGYWGQYRVADSLPFDYWPED